MAESTPGVLSPQISLVIPAYNAAATLAQTLDSLLAQSHPAWEAVVVDDGSTDETAELARRFARQDARIRLVQAEHRGVSAARNTGILQARFDWLAFLDADDWLGPEFLSSMAQAISADPALDAAYCGWARVADGAAPFIQRPALRSGVLFDQFIESCYFPINACVVRKSLVLSVQGFDPSLSTCEDWDLWLRVARSGARFGAVPQVLSFYRFRPGSASVDARQLLTDAFRVLERAHSPDDRLPHQHPDYPSALTPLLLLARKYQFLCWCAGMLIAAGQDASSLLDVLSPQVCPHLDGTKAVTFLVESIQVAGHTIQDGSVESWTAIWPRLRDFLRTLERQTQASNLVDAAGLRLLRLHLEASPQSAPVSFGAAHTCQIQLEEPLKDLHFPDDASRLICQAAVGGDVLGLLELPIYDGLVPGDILADAAAAQCAWEILDRFFQLTLYAGFATRRDPGGISVWRGEVRLADGLEDSQDSVSRLLHERAGWTIFLQEFWGIPNRPLDWFYNPDEQEPAEFERAGDDGWISLELSQALPDVVCTVSLLQVIASVAGVVIGVAALPVENGLVTAHALRVALTRQCGFELCRAAVREGLLGQPIRSGASLRQRLDRACRLAAESPVQLLAPDLPGASEFAGDWQLSLSRALQSLQKGVALPRYWGGEIDTSVSRRSVFPSSVYPDLVEAADRWGAPLVHVDSQPGQPVGGVYAPGLIRKTPPASAASGTPSSVVERISADPGQFHGRGVFEAIFAAKADPWHYTSPYEQIKYQQSLDLLPARPFKRALEIGCAEGHFTAQLAPRCEVLLAADLSRVALERAAQRCAGLDHIQFLSLDLSLDPLPGQFDLVVCSEILYYVGGRETLPAIAEKLSEALLPGGLLLMAHAHLVVDEPDKTGFNWDHPFGAAFIATAFQEASRLRLVRELRTPLYRIQLFQRKPRFFLPIRWKRPELVALPEQPAPPPPGADAQVLWQGGKPQHSQTGLVETHQLPILLYHRVAPHGSQSLQPYRVSPQAFEEQLSYLRDAGYYCVTIEEWHAAMKEHRSLPGRAVLLTFDDGYRDFKEFAWPLLQRYGFSALVFLVAGEVGGSNSWDRQAGETLPLLDWDEIRELEEAGIQFGSHSSSHPLLTAISPTEMLREAIRSRSLLEQRLAAPVRSFAYPFGGEDPVVRHVIGASGFIYGFTSRTGRCGLWEPLLGLPRIEVSGSDRFEDFVRKLA